MDESDQATDQEIKSRDIALSKRMKVIPYIGACHNCSEPLDRGVFCSPECREDYEVRDRQEHRNPI